MPAEFTHTGGASGKEPFCQCRRHKGHRFDPWVRQMPWRWEWKPTPVFLPGESHGQRRLAGYSSQGRKDLDTTEVIQYYSTSKTAPRVQGVQSTFLKSKKVLGLDAISIGCQAISSSKSVVTKNKQMRAFCRQSQWLQY